MGCLLQRWELGNFAMANPKQFLTYLHTRTTHPHHSAQPPSPTPIICMLSSWMLKNSTMTFAPHFPSTPSWQHICHNPHCTQLDTWWKWPTSSVWPNFTSLMLMIFALKSYNTSMITFSPDIFRQNKTMGLSTRICVAQPLNLCANILQVLHNLHAFKVTPPPQTLWTLEGNFWSQERPWNSISINFIEHLPASVGFTSILVVVDRLSKQGIFITTVDEITTPWTCQTLPNPCVLPSMEFCRMLLAIGVLNLSPTSSDP